MERDEITTADIVDRYDFNSHAHVERDCSTHGWSQRLPHFNSHAHVERDFHLAHMVAHSNISTHTLTWSVTAFNLSTASMSTISTHTLTWSVTTNAY